MKNWLIQNWFKLGLLLMIILVASSLSYYYLIFLPKKEEVKNIERSRVEKILNDCLSQADWQHLSIFERIARVSDPQNWENIPVQITYRNITGDTDSEKKENLKLWERARNECFKE